MHSTKVKALMSFKLFLCSSIPLVIAASGGLVNAGPADSGTHYFSGPDLRKASELMACRSLEKVFEENSLIEPVDYKGSCLETAFGVDACGSSRAYLYGNRECAKNSQIYIKFSKNSIWLECKPAKRPYRSGYGSRRVLACGSSLILPGDIPSIGSLAKRSSVKPFLYNGYYSRLDIENNDGEKDIALPFYSIVSKLEIGGDPRVEKKNLVYKYYFPIRLQVIAKFVLKGSGQSFYLKKDQKASLYLGSRKKKLFD